MGSPGHPPPWKIQRRTLSIFKVQPPGSIFHDQEAILYNLGSWTNFVFPFQYNDKTNSIRAVRSGVRQ